MTKQMFTDGSCSPNPGPGGYAVILNDKPVALGWDTNSTNIRMEGMALIAALKLAQSESYEIHTDSEFWINVITKWSVSWEANGWKKKSGPIMNLDIVQELCKLHKTTKGTLVWTRAHVGTLGNEQADEWANRARQERLDLAPQ